MEPFATSIMSLTHQTKSRTWRRCSFLVVALAVAGSARAQPLPADHATHQHPATAPATQALGDQVQELKAKIAQLDEALRRANPGAGMGQATSAPGGVAMAGGQPGAMAGMPPSPQAAPPAPPAAMAGMGGAAPAAAPNMGGMMQEMGSMMQMMGGMMGAMKPGGPEMAGMKPGGAVMGGMKMDAPEMGGKGMGGMKMGGSPAPASGGMAGMPGGPPPQMASSPAGGMSGMGGMEKMEGMMGMPPVGAMGGAGSMTAALPGFPGASHLYHIGGTGFFLDHAEHISLTVPQQAALNAVKEKAMLAKAANQRKVDTAEQELWALTASDQPDATKIDAKIREAEKLRGDERLDFIRSVGDAAKLLTDGQRQSLLGFQPPQPAIAPAGAMAPT